MPSVSVIIPTHNRAHMVRQAIQSVISQTFQDFELIVISDGSTDNTEETVTSFADPRIRYVKHETARGASAARNTGIRESRGKFLAFLDDDDEWLPRKLEVQVASLATANERVGLVYAWIEYFDGERIIQRRCPLLKGNIFLDMLDKQAITNSSALLVKREVFDVVEGFDEELPRGNDGDFIRRVAKRFEVDFIPEVLTRLHVGHDDRITVDSRKNLKNAVFEYEKRLCTFADDYAKFSVQEANVFAKIACNCFKIGDLKKGFKYFVEIYNCDLKVKTKLNLISLMIKDVSKYFLKKVIGACRPYVQNSKIRGFVSRTVL